MKQKIFPTILSLCSIAWCLVGCEKEDISFFNSQYNAVRFNSTNNYDEDSQILKENFSFLETPFDEYKEYELPLALIGNIHSEDRMVNYVIDLEETTAPENSYEILDARIPSNSYIGFIRIKIYNTEEIQAGADYKIAILLNKSSTLELGPEKYQKATLTWNNNIIAPPASSRYLWMTYNSLIKSSLPNTSTATTQYSSNAMRAIVAALGWNDWDDMTAHPDYIQRATYYTYKYLADYRLLMLDNSHEAFAKKLSDYLEAYRIEHPDAPLIHNDGALKGQPIEARTY